MIDPLVRRAASGDVGPLRVLEAEARASLIEARGGTAWLQEHHLIGDGGRRASPTIRSSSPCSTSATARPSSSSATSCWSSRLPIATVDQVYVIPDARELGFGDALLEAATAAAVDAGAHVIEGFALPGDRNTKNLYERAGITARLITVSRRLRLVSGPSSSGSASR